MTMFWRHLRFQDAFFSSFICCDKITCPKERSGERALSWLVVPEEYSWSWQDSKSKSQNQPRDRKRKMDDDISIHTCIEGGEQGYRHPKPAPSDLSPPALLRDWQISNLPEKPHQLGTKYFNTWVDERLFSLNLLHQETYNRNIIKILVLESNKMVKENFHIWILIPI